MVHLIHGFFFQKTEGLATVVGPDGDVAVIKKYLGRYAFSGVLWPGKGDTDGGMTDFFGDSDIFDLTMDDGMLCFKKRYRDRNYVVSYSLVKEPGGTYAGTYEVEGGDPGTARCVLVEVSEEFFQPPSPRR